MMTTTAHGAAVHIENCGKTFADGTQALAPASLDIVSGETLVLLGPSGCGKTTMLRIIAGLETPDQGGRVLFDAQDMTLVPIEQRHVGMVFQSYALFPNMSVADNIGYGLKIRGVGRAARDQRIAEMVALTNLTGLQDRRIDQLSGGQRQRVALARAVAIRPRVLLLDEPLTALDASLRDRLRGELNRLLRSLGITAIYVTHDQAEAMELGDRIVVMRKGAIAQIGTPREVYFAPTSRFVAEFVGAANIIEAPVAEGHLVLPGGRLEVATAANAAVATAAVATAAVATAAVATAAVATAAVATAAVATAAVATAMIRPETIAIVDAANSPLRGVIDSISFIGDRQRIVVTGAADKALTIDAPNTVCVKTGERVGLSIAPAAVRMLPGEE